MKSHVFLTPMSPDGTPGELVEVRHNDEARQMYLEPLAYFAEPNSDEIQKKLDALTAKLPTLKSGERAKVNHEIRDLQRELRVALDHEESERRHDEREKERPRQQIGADSPFSRNEAPQTFAELAASVAETVAAPSGTEVKRKRTTKADADEGWERYLARLDERLAGRAAEGLREITARPQVRLAVHDAATCCSGQYKCGRCRAEAAAA